MRINQLIMKKQLNIALLMVVISVGLWSQETITIEGMGFDPYNEVHLKVYTFKSLGYETLVTLGSTKTVTSVFNSLLSRQICTS